MVFIKMTVFKGEVVDFGPPLNKDISIFFSMHNNMVIIYVKKRVEWRGQRGENKKFQRRKLKKILSKLP